MTKLEKIDREIQKEQEKLAAAQARLKEVDERRIEQENLQIVQQIRALKLSRDQFRTFVESGEMPASLADAIADAGVTGTQSQTADTEPSASTEPEKTSDSAESSESSNSSDYTAYNASYSSCNDSSDDDDYRDRRDRDEDE